MLVLSIWELLHIFAKFDQNAQQTWELKSLDHKGIHAKIHINNL